MFKVDWPCAIGGAFLGYYAKGKVESTKAQFKGICTGAISTLKEAFAEDSQSQAPQAGQGTGTTKNGKNG